MKKQVLYFCVGWGLNWGLIGQNLVPNPSFETYTSCPTSFAQINNATGWTYPTNHTGSPDYLNTCGAMGTTNPASNYFGSQAPRTGNGMAGMANYYQSTANFREYLLCQLTTPLSAGVTYQFQTYVSLAENSVYGTDGFQVYLSATAPVGSGGWAPLPLTPQISWPTGNCITNRTGWTLVSGNYTAIGGERFMTIGNYDNDAATSTSYVSPASYTTGYYYYDDVSFAQTVILSAELDGPQAEFLGNFVAVDWKTLQESGLASFEVERSEDLVHFEKIGMVPAVGNRLETTPYKFVDKHLPVADHWYYRLHTLDEDGSEGYSITVEVQRDGRATPALTLFPNPSPIGSQPVVGWNSTEAGKQQVSLWDVNGRVLGDFEADCTQGWMEFSLPLEGTSPGIYFVHLPGVGTQKWVVK